MVSLPIILGAVLFTLITYLLAWVDLSILIVIPYGIFFVLMMKKHLWSVYIEKKHTIYLLATIFVSLFYTLPVLVTGVWQNAVIHGDDVIHLAYIQELIAHFPPNNPGLSNIPLFGYHFFHDFFLSRIFLLTRIPVEFIYFRISPIFTSLLLGLSVYTFIYSVTKNKLSSFLSVLLTLYGGSFGYFLLLSGNSPNSISNVFGINQPVISLLNPPFAFSLVLIVTALLLSHQYIKQHTTRLLFIIAIIVGITPSFKVYAGILLYGFFLLLIGKDILKQKFSSIVFIFLAILISLITYGVFSKDKTYLTLHPLWAPHGVLQFNLPWYGFEEKMYTYKKLNVLRGLIKVESYGLFLFIIGNLGTRVFGFLLLFFYIMKKQIKHTTLIYLITILAITSLCIPLFFIQSVQAFDIIQFAWYYPFFIALLAGVGFGIFYKKIKTKYVRTLFLILLFLFTIPGTIDDFNTFVLSYIHTKKQARSFEFYEAMDYLRKDPLYDNTVLEIPPKTSDTSTDEITKWYRKTIPYFSAYAKKSSYFNSQNIVFPYMEEEIKKRAEFISLFVHATTLTGKESSYSGLLNNIKEKIKKENIHYIFSRYPITLFEHEEDFQTIYNQNSYFITKIY